MADGLAYFKAVYGTVPTWISSMHEHNPNMLKHYTDLRGEAFAAGALSSRDKDDLIMAVNVARLYAPSMLNHVKGMVAAGASMAEFIEYFWVAYCYQGDQALLMSTQALALALQLRGQTVPPALLLAQDVETILAQYQALTEPDQLNHLNHIIACYQANDRAALEQAVFEQGLLPSKIKLLAMLGNYVVTLQAAQADTWLARARAVGVSDGELADLGFVCLLTAGIPAWFESCDVLAA